MNDKIDNNIFLDEETDDCETYTQDDTCSTGVSKLDALKLKSKKDMKSSKAITNLVFSIVLGSAVSFVLSIIALIQRKKYIVANDENAKRNYANLTKTAAVFNMIRGLIVTLLLVLYFVYFGAAIQKAGGISNLVNSFRESTISSSVVKDNISSNESEKNNSSLVGKTYIDFSDFNLENNDYLPMSLEQVKTKCGYQLVSMDKTYHTAVYKSANGSEFTADLDDKNANVIKILLSSENYFNTKENITGPNGIVVNQSATPESIKQQAGNFASIEPYDSYTDVAYYSGDSSIIYRIDNSTNIVIKIIFS